MRVRDYIELVPARLQEKRKAIPDARIRKRKRKIMRRVAYSMRKRGIKRAVIAGQLRVSVATVSRLVSEAKWDMGHFDMTDGWSEAVGKRARLSRGAAKVYVKLQKALEAKIEATSSKQFRAASDHHAKLLKVYDYLNWKREALY
jgi:predicted transcriptional regulator